MAAANCRSLSPTLTVAYQADLGCLSSGHTRLVTIFRSGGVSFTETCSWADISSRLTQFSLVLTRSGLSLGLGEPDSDSVRRNRKDLSWQDPAHRGEAHAERTQRLRRVPRAIEDDLRRPWSSGCAAAAVRSQQEVVSRNGKSADTIGAFAFWCEWPDAVI
jgi:hypothetical protein